MRAVDRRAASAAILVTLLVPSALAAQPAALDYPTRPVRMIVPLAPGGGSDIVARIVSSGLSDRWGQSVVVDNRPGAGSTVGTAIAAKAVADGYTVLVSSSSLAISPALYKNLSFDMRRDFEKITLIASQPSILATSVAAGVSTLKELLALAKERPGKLAFASAGPGSATHLGTELLQHAAGIKLLHVPYKSAGLATTALLSGETQVLLTNMASLLPHVKTGKLKGLGVSSLQRSPQAPELPTLSEAGMPGFEYQTWYGMVAPAGTPRSIVARLHEDTAAAISEPGVREKLTTLGLTGYGTSPVEFRKYMEEELVRWEGVVKAAGVTLN